MRSPTLPADQYALAIETSGAVGSVALGRDHDLLDARTFSAPLRHAIEFLPTVEALCRTYDVKPEAIGRVYVSIGPGSFTGLRIGVTAARMIAFAARQRTRPSRTSQSARSTHRQLEHGQILDTPTRAKLADRGASARSARQGPMPPVADPPAEQRRVDTAHHASATSDVAVELVPVPTLDVIAQNAFALAEPPPHLAVILDAKRKRVYGGSFARKGSCYVATSEPAELDPASFLAGQPRDCGVIGEGVIQHRTVVKASGLDILPDSLYTPGAETVYRLGLELAKAGRFAHPRDLVPLYIRPPEAEEKWQAHHNDSRK